MALDDHPLFEPAAAVSDGRPTAAVSQSEGIRLIDRIIRVFGARAADAPEPGTQSLFSWGTLEVKRSLGAGAFGEVFAAWDPTLRREVALKLRIPEVGALRWLDEARNLARVRHPNVLTVYGADVLEGRAGIWTELISGRALEQELESVGPLPEAEVLRIGRDIASALAAVHAAGLVHGDVKPANIMLEDGDAPRRAVLVDFGAADRMLESGEIPAYLVGTPLTMAPEVLDGQPATGASDVYGLGATLFRLLTGRYPVEAQTIDELKRAHASGPRASVRALAPNVSPRLARVLTRALETAPANRWPSAKAFRRALDDVADPTRRIRARAAAIGASAAAVAAIIVVAILIARPGPGPIARASLSAPRVPDLLLESWRRSGPQSRAGWGWVGTTLDLDGDGMDELLAGEPLWADADSMVRGRVWIFQGTPQGPSAIADTSLVGETDDVQFGDHIDSAGDVDADGFDDLLVMERATGPNESLPRVRLFRGSPNGVSRTASWTIKGQGRDSWMGTAMTCAGDVNRDGYNDVLIGEGLAKDPLHKEGLVHLFLGSASGLSPTAVWKARGGQDTAQLGTWMRRAGDVNGDGFDDVVLGAAYWDGVDADCGQARLYWGGPRGASPEPVWTFDGAGANSQLATTVGGAGDVNRDGFDDIVIGEPQYSDAARPERGRVLVFFGGPHGPSSSPDWQAMGPVAYMRFGYMAIGVGDVDADGFPDIAIGAHQYTDGKRVHLGAVEVYRGGRKGPETVASWRAIGDRPDAHLGQMVWPGDLNGDGAADVVVGTAVWGNAIAERGLILVYLAQPTSR